LFLLDKKRRSYSYEPARSIDFKEVESDNAASSLFDRIDAEMNRPFPGEPHHPFRWFFLPDPRTDSHFLLAIYHHVAADGAATCALIKRTLGHYWGMPQPGDEAPLDVSPAPAGRPYLRSLLGAIRLHAELRHAHRPREREEAGERAAFLHRAAPDGFLERLVDACRRRQVTVNDAFLAALCASLAEMTPGRREHERRRALALGTIVDLRAPSRDAARSSFFRACLGYVLHMVRDPDAGFDDLLSQIASRTQAAKAENEAAGFQWGYWALTRLRGCLPIQNTRRWYRKFYPLSGGVSNMKLERASFPGGGDGLLDYFRVVPTGPALPLALAPTTLDRQLSLSLTYREASLRRSEAERLLEAIFSRLEALSARVVKDASR
jgi:hypothetical protein